VCRMRFRDEEPGQWSAKDPVFIKLILILHACEEFTPGWRKKQLNWLDVVVPSTIINSTPSAHKILKAASQKEGKQYQMKYGGTWRDEMHQKQWLHRKYLRTFLLTQSFKV
jgi:predicted KAP-like P-loop ATPase